MTWSRPRDIATKDPAHGGLGLFRDTSQQCKDLVGKSPTAIVATKPEKYLKYLKLLEGKEHILHKLAVRDLEQRSLGAETRAAVLNLGDIKSRMCRWVLPEILEKCMFLLYFKQKYNSVATSTAWNDMMQKAVVDILNLELTPLILQRFGWNEKALQALDEMPKTWYTSLRFKWWVRRTLWQRDCKWPLISTGLSLTKQLHT